MDMLNTPKLVDLREQVNAHPIYRAVDSLPRLRCFMQHHIYAVWDFMSLLKAVQGIIAPAGHPWLPGKDTTLRRFINDLVLGEESDEWLLDGQMTYISHFDLYQKAMLEVGAGVKHSNEFIHLVYTLGVDAALRAPVAPGAARQFMRTTFDVLAGGKPHGVMAFLAAGREHIIPEMFRILLREMAIDETSAPAFHYYLNRHVVLDEDRHGPMALRLLEMLCEGDATRIAEAQAAAEVALSARLTFWDGVLAAMAHTGAGCLKKRAA